MGTEERQRDPDLSERLAALVQDPERFSFFRLVHLLERMTSGAPPIGQLGPASEERIRLRPDAALTFSSSDVTAAETVRFPDGVDRVRVTATFLGLYGAVSPLPVHYSEQIALSVYQGGPQPVREFLDIFHHRLLSLVYRAWSKYRIGAAYRRRGTDSFTRRMFCTTGVDGFRDHALGIDRFLFLRYAPLLASKSRSARGLTVVLEDLYGKMGVRVEQFIGHWTRLEKPLRNLLGVVNHQLGHNLTLGRYVYDGTGRFTIVLGPLGYDEYLSFLPGGHERPRLRGIVDTFTRGIYEVMLELHVKADAAPRFQLGSPRASTLRRTAWLGGARGAPFVITVPLAEPAAPGSAEEEDEDDRGEPPPM
jgi:type VI secretion system protein ImpH